MTSNELAGFPHSEISGSLVVCTSPELIAAYHVLHRLHAPRHPPCALSSLTIEFAQYKLDQHIDSLTPRSSRDLAISEEIFSIGNFAYSIVKKHVDDFCRPKPRLRGKPELYRSRTSLVKFGSRSRFQDKLKRSFKGLLRPLVEVRGLEPLTPWLQTMCSAS